MYKVIDKVTIMNEIAPKLPKGKRGFNPRVPIYEIVNAILYKLKTGVQWKYLPVKALFEQDPLSWNSVYHHYRKWCNLGAWRDCWIELLKEYKSKLDLSSLDLDGSHTPALRGGEQVAYQGRKKRKTTNALYLSDRNGLPISISNPVAGNHNDLYDIEVQFEVITGDLKDANIAIDGLFINIIHIRSKKISGKCRVIKSVGMIGD